MSTLVNVARYHLMDRLQYLMAPCAITAFAFALNLAVFAVIPVAGGAYSGGLVTLYAFLFVPGVFSVTRSLPFGFALGLSRRTYYLGTILLALGMGAVFSLAATVLQAVERATDGWGLAMHFFRVPWLFDGPWYQTWPTSFVLLVLMYVYGMWFGLVFRRWQVAGMLTFIAVQATGLVVSTLIITWTHSWPAVLEFFATLSVFGLTGVLAVFVMALVFAGFTAIRRVAV